MTRALIALAVIVASTSLASTCDELPAILIVQDRSGSMASAPAGGTVSDSNPSKWTISKTEVPALAWEFANRLRFGVMLFPATTSCSAGTVLSPISYNPADVQAIYQDKGETTKGSTPTADSLDAARIHLLGLKLTTPKYVLLITDGMPNCTDGISGTIAAATKLKDAGILVGVVGFGTEATSQNNKANLDKIAAAGGTTSAFSAKDRPELAAVLAQIAGSASNCCKDACTLGATQCNGSGVKQVCQMNTTVGCTNWVNTTCSDGTSCSGGTCQACQNTCSPGATRCSGNGVQTCEKTATGCYKWSASDECATNYTCSNGACVGCGTAACTDGAKRCGAAGVVEECRNDATGCLSWSKIAQCNTASGGSCQNGACVGACTDACAEGAGACVSGRPQTCARGTNGCTAWKTGASCKTGSTCAEGGCRFACANDELSTCPDGLSCELVGSARLCMPIAAPDAGVVTTGPSDSPVASGGADGGIIANGPSTAMEGVGGSTGCSTSPAILSMLLALWVVVARHTRRVG